MSCDGIEPKKLAWCWYKDAPFARLVEWLEHPLGKPVNLVGSTITIKFSGVGAPTDLSSSGGSPKITIPAHVTLSGAAAVGADTLSINALSADVPKGKVLYFGAAVRAVTTEDATAGDTALKVSPLSSAISSGGTAPLGYFKTALSSSDITAMPAGTYTGKLVIILASGDALVPRDCNKVEVEVTIE